MFGVVCGLGHGNYISECKCSVFGKKKFFGITAAAVKSALNCGIH